MLALFQQLAILDTLLSNWDAIRSYMGPVQPAIDRGLALIAARLSAAKSSDDLALIIDDLLDVTMDTPAHDYVRELIARSTLDSGGSGSVRGIIGTAVSDAVAANRVKECMAKTAHGLSQTLSATTSLLTIPVFFATNRKAVSGFTGEPADYVTYGQAQVTIPVTAHTMGTLETQPWWQRHLFLKPNQEKYVVLDEVRHYGSSEFASALAGEFHQGRVDDLLVFLHGYNVTFEEAARRVAQLSYDLQFKGVVVLFSWPSVGRSFSYAADEDHAAASAKSLTEFLQALEGGPWRKVHLMAHSMGNRVMVLGLADYRRLTVALGQIILVAADMYVKVFEQKFPNIAGTCDLFTSYAAKADKALLLSSIFHQDRRIGYIKDEPFEMEGLETIDASAVDTSLLGHSYFSDERTVLTDLSVLLREGSPAQRRGLLQAPGKTYWSFAR